MLLLASLLLLAGAAPDSPRSASAQSTPSTLSPKQSQRAATLADYRSRVRLSFELAEGLALVYAGEVAEGSEESEAAPATDEGEPEEIEELLPPKERVEWSGRFIEVDNAWVHEALEQLGSEEDDEKIAAGFRALGAQLRALEARLAEMEGGASAEVDRDAERGRLNSILRRPEFDRQSPQKQQGALARMIDDFIEWFSSLFPKRARVMPGASPQVSTGVLIFVGALCLAVLGYIARVLWRRRGMGRRSLGLKRGARVVLGERLEADQTAADLLEEAERLARGGELRGAIRKAYVALLCELGDRGVVRLAQHKTNRDYLNAVRRAARPRLYTEMLPLTNDFELHWYGLRPASAADWDSFKARCRTMLKEVDSRQ